MKGAEKIFIHGEEIARQQDLKQEINDRMNAVANVEWQAQQYTNQRISEIPEVDPQKWVDSGFNYTYEDPDHESPVTITVEPFGDSYGFNLDGEGYYVNNNVGIDQSYAMCKIVINNTTDTDQTLKFKLNQLSENGCDFGMFSVLNTDLVANVDDINTNVAISFQNYNGDIDYNIGVPVGESYVTVKYKKDGSESQQTDTFKFKMISDNIITVTRHLSTEENVEDKIKQAISTVYKYKGSVANEASLPTTNNEVGDVYNCEDTGNNFAWDGTKWDSLVGIVDMSNYYTKAQSDASARAIADEKIAAIPVSNLLHYKGHLSDVSLLPSLGQTSGEVSTNNFNLSRWKYNNNNKFFISNNDVLNFKKYFLMYGLNNTTNNHFGFLTDYPEQIEMSIGFIDGAHPVPVFKVTYNPNKPVYFWCGGTTYSVVSELYVDVDGSLKQATPVTSGSTKNFTQYKNNAFEQITRTAYFLPGMMYDGDSTVPDLESYGNMNIKTNTPAIKMFNFVDSFSALSWKYTGTTEEYHIYSMFESLKHPTKTYYYNAGMLLFKATTTSSSSNIACNINFISDEPGETQLNDTYTVGDNYDIYRRNEEPKWEHWSKSDSYTKAEIDAMIGEIDTVLDSILNEPELVEDELEVPDVG